MWLAVHSSTLKYYLTVWGFVIDQKFCFLMQYFWSFYVIFKHCIISLGISYLLLPAQHLIPRNIFSKDFFPLQWFQSILLVMCAWPYVSSGCPLPSTVFTLVTIFKIRDISWKLASCFASGISGRFCLFHLILFYFYIILFQIKGHVNVQLTTLVNIIYISVFTLGFFSTWYCACQL